MYNYSENDRFIIFRKKILRASRGVAQPVDRRAWGLGKRFLSWRLESYQWQKALKKIYGLDMWIDRYIPLKKKILNPKI